MPQLCACTSSADLLLLLLPLLRLAAGWLMDELGVGSQTRRVAITHCGDRWWVTAYRPLPKVNSAPGFQVKLLSSCVS